MAGDAAAATAADGQAQQQDGAQAPQFDPGVIEGRFAELAQGQEESRQLLQGLMAQLTQDQGQETGQEPEPIDLSEFLDPGQDAEALGQQLQQVVDQRVQHGVQQALAQLQPDIDRMRELRSDVEMERLVAEFPVLGENEEMAKTVFQAASALAQANGWGPEIANHPQFLRQTTLAAIGARALADEAKQAADDDGGAATLEGAAGAVPGGGSGAMTAEQLLGARPGRVLPF